MRRLDQKAQGAVLDAIDARDKETLSVVYVSVMSRAARHQLRCTGCKPCPEYVERRADSEIITRLLADSGCVPTISKNSVIPYAKVEWPDGETIEVEISRTDGH